MLYANVTRLLNIYITKKILILTCASDKIAIVSNIEYVFRPSHAVKLSECILTHWEQNLLWCSHSVLIKATSNLRRFHKAFGLNRLVY